MRFEKVSGPVRRRTAAPSPRRPAVPEISRRDEPSRQGPAALPDPGPVRPRFLALFSLGASAALFAFFLLDDRGILQEKRLRQRVVDLQAEVSRTYSQNEQLGRDVERLMKDPAAAEKIAREELNLVRPGDVVVILPKGWQESAAKATTAAQVARTAKTDRTAKARPVDPPPPTATASPAPVR